MSTIHQYQIPEKYESACQFAAAATKALKGNGKIVTGADVDDIEFRRVPTGLPFFDYVTNGGLIRGGATQLWGKYKSTKTTVLAHIIRDLQRRRMSVVLASIEKFSKPWWRQIGVFIPYGDKELLIMDTETRKKARKYNAFFIKKEHTPLTLIVHQDSVQSLELVYRAFASNTFDLVAVDSLGAVVDSTQVEESNLADRTYGGQSAIFSMFCKKMTAAQNYTFDGDNKRSPTGEHANQSMLICINQARQELGAPPKTTWDKKIHPVGGEALHHLWDQSLAFQSMADVKDTQAYDGKTKPNVYAKEFDVKGTKMRGGPEQREVRYELSIKERREGGRIIRAGQFNNVANLRAIAAMVGVTTQKGAFISYGGRKFNGKPAFEAALHDGGDFYDEVYAAMMERAYLDSLSSPVPEVWEYVD